MPETTMKVYDILNAGPRHKFMVRSKTTRQPMIVHNCLYGCGWKKLLHTATLWGVDVTPDLIQLVHAQYRVSHPPVVEAWDFFDTLLHRWASKDRFEDGESISIFEITAKGLRSPTGFLIQYPDLEVSVRPFGRKFVRSYTYWNAARRSRANVHRGLVLENCSQHAAGAVFNDMMVRIERRATEVGGLFCGDVHDEMIYRAPVGLGGEVLKIMQEEMKVPPVWWPELPVTSEGEHGFGILETDTGFTMASRYGMLK